VHAAVGAAVGALVGDLLGAMVGLSVGAAVGLSVGAAVGGSVGAPGGTAVHPDNPTWPLVQVPVAQALPDSDPAAAENLPAEHGGQATALEVPECLPAGHSSQTLVPKTS
jgi:hypothetical protein